MKRHKFTEEEIYFIKSVVKGKDTKTIADLVNEKFELNLTALQIQTVKNNYNLKSGIDTRFKKGQVPANKGKKGINKANKTSFKKGNIPANRKPIGSERKDKRDGSILIKVQDGNLTKNWMSKSRYIYEQAYGKIPKGYKVIFADKNNQNFDLDNLILVSSAEELIMNRRKLIKNDKELTKTGAVIAKVIDKVNKINEKYNKNE